MNAADRMAEGRRADCVRRRQRVITTLNDLAGSGGEITVSAVARAAGVDRTFLYRHNDLLGQVHAAAAQPGPPTRTGQGVSRASLQADLLAANARCVRLANQVRHLEHRLTDALGEQIWREAGIGAPTDVEQLQARITTLEQQLVDQRLRLDERTEELDAARTGNSEGVKL